jgi:hypothetical protein
MTKKGESSSFLPPFFADILFKKTAHRLKSTIFRYYAVNLNKKTFERDS